APGPIFTRSVTCIPLEEGEDQSTEMPRRRADWSFGPRRPFSEESAAQWKRYEPTVDKWLTEMEAAGDPRWQSAEHAAQCLVADVVDFGKSWGERSVAEFLFSDLWEGGTVGFFGSHEILFDQLVEAMRRFVSDGLVDARAGKRWLRELADMRGDFLRCYDPETSEEAALAIARRRYWERLARVAPVVTGPSASKREAARRRRRAKRRRSRRS